MTEAADQGAPQVDQTTIRRAIGAAALGNTMEWYDYGVYAYVVTTIGQVFFPDSAALLSSLAVLAVSFILRPAGGVFFGRLGDKIGRQRALAATIMMMAGGTFLIGVLPGYATLGIWAPIILVILRLVQGFSTGGEYAGAATFMAEYAPDRSRGFLGGFLPVGTLWGYSLGAGFVTALTLTLPDADMSSWGWRLPFLVALPLGVIGLVLRLKIEDTPVFRELQGNQSVSEKPLRQTLRQHPDRAGLFIGVVILLMISNYVLLTYLPTYMSTVLDTSHSNALLILIGVMLAMAATAPFVGRLSDRIGRKPLLVASAVCFILFSYPAFMLISQGQLVWTVVGVALIGLFEILYLGTEPATLPALFPAPVRYAGFAMSYNVAVAAFGGTAPIIVEALIKATGNTYIPAFYLMAAGLVSLGPILLMPETALASLRGSERPKAASAEPEATTRR